jgi:hypothetical protein
MTKTTMENDYMHEPFDPKKQLEPKNTLVEFRDFLEAEWCLVLV